MVWGAGCKLTCFLQHHLRDGGAAAELIADRLLTLNSLNQTEVLLLITSETEERSLR